MASKPQLNTERLKKHYERAPTRKTEFPLHKRGVIRSAAVSQLAQANQVRRAFMEPGTAFRKGHASPRTAPCDQSVSSKSYVSRCSLSNINSTLTDERKTKKASITLSRSQLLGLPTRQPWMDMLEKNYQKTTISVGAY